MKEDILTLLPGVRSAEENGRLGLTLYGRTRLTDDKRQIALLNSLLAGPQSVDSLGILLGAGNDPPGGEAFAALALAEFILNFKDYLET